MCDKEAIEVQKILPFLSDTWPLCRIGRAVIRASQSCRQSCNKSQCPACGCRSHHSCTHAPQFSRSFPAREWGSVLQRQFAAFLKCKMRPYSDVLSATEVSKFTGYHHNTITTWCSNGYFRYFKIGSSYMIPKVCILNFLVSPHVLDSYRPAQKMVALAKEFGQQGKPTEKSSA